MSQLKVNSIVDAAGGSSAVLYGVASPPNSMGFRNRIINGEMRIDQRNNGASVTLANSANAFAVDRFVELISYSSAAYTAQRSSTAPVGFANSLLITTTTASSPSASNYAWIQQVIEGYNIADLGWGTANASTITLSFWVRSSLTGTFSGALQNNAQTRSYPFTYTISAANTWEQKTVTIVGDTTGTWLTDNSGGIRLFFTLGAGSTYSGTAGAWAGSTLYSATGATSVVGTNGATFYITGVQLEAGTVASPFERRDYGRELMMCQRYYQTTYNGVVAGTVSTSGNLARYLDGTTAYASHSGQFPVAMRATPTMAVYNPNTGAVSSMAADASNPAAVATALGPTGYRLYVNNVSVGVSVGLSAHYTANSEL